MHPRYRFPADPPWFVEMVRDLQRRRAEIAEERETVLARMADLRVQEANLAAFDETA